MLTGRYLCCAQLPAPAPTPDASTGGQKEPEGSMKEALILPQVCRGAREGWRGQ